tara:strand:- start:670 stop:993 length:324 start_codon:yes stop_codon:yes gene_type:complete
MVDKEIRRQQSYVRKKVARWDMFAKAVPAAIITLNFILLVFNYVDFHNAFWLTLILVSSISCVWWAWTVITVRMVNNTLTQAEDSLLDVKKDIKEIVRDVKEFQTKP